MKRFSKLSQIIYIGCFLLIGSLMGILFYEFQLTFMPFKDCIMISSIGSLLTIVLQLIINSRSFSERAPLPTSLFCIAVLFLYFFSICILTIIYSIYLRVLRVVFMLFFSSFHGFSYVLLCFPFYISLQNFWRKIIWEQNKNHWGQRR